MGSELLTSRKRISSHGTHETSTDFTLTGSGGTGIRVVSLEILAHLQALTPNGNLMEIMTQNRSVDAALDWLEKYGDNPPEEEKDEDVSMKEEGVHKPYQHQKMEKAKGLKCTECDKFFKNNALASYHSEKSGHVNFDEMEYELRDQLKERQLAKQKIEIAENKANEAIRRKGGKDMKDKLDDERAKARARAAIAEDKAERIRKAAFEKSKRTGLPPPPDPPMVAKPPAKKSTSAVVVQQRNIQRVDFNYAYLVLKDPLSYSFGC
ncbi:hypothetical protein KEM48_005928 [Puccinia striiformis f. sp. tritici PST-130]|nr:hypothetical protein KEM48_005928 [Puccinia striiformis f. sp. tritici PST-130]